MLWDDDMAFQMIPPRLSSSPPPLDSLPTVMCPGEDDDDEEFGNFSTHNASFDITGLSDKLPPTPDSSPSKFPALGRVAGKILPAVLEGTREDTISQDSGVGSSNHPNEFSPQPQVDDHSFGEFSGCDLNTVKVNNEMLTGVRNDDGDCGFADFQAFNTSVAFEPPRIQEPESITYSSDISNVNQGDDETSSHAFPSAPECSENSGTRSSRNSFSMIGTPPPLDYVANNVTLDDEFTCTSSNFPADCDDDFGDFASSKVSEIISGGCLFQDSVDNESVHLASSEEKGTLQGSGKDKEKMSLNSKGYRLDSVRGADSVPVVSKPSRFNEGSDSAAQDVLNLDMSVDIGAVINEGVVLCTSVRNEYSSHVSKTPVDNVLNPDNELLDDIGNETSIESPRTSLQTKSNVTFNQKGEVTGQFSSVSTEKIKDACVDVNNFDSVQVSHNVGVNKLSENTDICLKEEAEKQLVIQSVGNDNWTDCNSIGFKSKSEGEIKHSGKSTVSESHVSASNDVSNVISDMRREERTAKEEQDCDKLYNAMVVKEQYGNSDSGDLSKVDGCSESDFGDFSKANDDEDDLDFADLREQVENGTFGAEESASLAPKDVGEFSDSNANTEDLEDEFGDFKAPTAVVIDTEFGDFDSANVGGSDDEFGDFEVHDKSSVSEGLCSQNHHNDDFGDFKDPASTEGFGSCSMASGERDTGMGDLSTSWSDNSFETSSKISPVLRKLESLVLKWIPKSMTAVTLQEEQPIPTLHQAVESDAFVWRQLENLESSAALTLSWGNTQAHNFFLSSVNVDARNIVSKEALITLFGQKWSSSVPLFAQTLSFSPLTPAKPKEGSGGPAVGFNGCNREPANPPVPVSPPQLKDETPVEVTTTKDGTSEEQIPPAKFDWTSSGLTNPLEGPAYNSSLFGLDLLLTNTSIGKGATNALLASLEREFLSESGEKSTSNRIKSPPTPSPLVQQILGGGMTKASLMTTPLNSLIPEVRQVVEHLPDLGFMRSKVLMFPIKGEQ